MKTTCHNHNYEGMQTSSYVHMSDNKARVGFKPTGYTQHTQR